MKASTISTILAFTATAIAAPVTAPTSYYTLPDPTTTTAFNKRSFQDAINNCGGLTDCITVVNAINDWDLSVNEVNFFLNNAADLQNPALTDAEQTALDFANKEPGFLSTLLSTPGLSAAGQNAGATLMQVFPTVPKTLQDLLNGIGSVQDGLNNINDVRCPSILGNISLLWIEAAAAVGSLVPGGALGPIICQKPGGDFNDAFN